MTVQMVKLAMTVSKSSQTKDCSSLSATGNSFKKCINNSVNQKTSDTTEKPVDDVKVGEDSKITEFPKDVNLLEINIVDGEMHVSVKENESTAELPVIDLVKLADEIKKFICKKLGIDEEEFYGALDKSGVNALNLFQVPALQDFFVSLKNMEEFATVLTNSELGDTWQMLMTGMSEFTYETDDITVTAQELTVLISKAEITVDSGILNTENDIYAKGIDKQTVVTENESNSDQEDIPEITLNVDGVANADNNSNSKNNLQQDADSEFMSGDNKAHTERSDDVKQETLFAQFMNKIEVAVKENNSPEFAVQQTRQMREIFTQVVDSIRINVKPETTGLEIQLNPEQLGKVNVTIEMKDGIATASFIVKNELAKTALEAQMQTLKETFENQGLKVESVEVSVSDFDFNQNSQTGYNNSNTEHKGRRFRNDDDISDNSMFGEENLQVHNTNISTDGGINLTA